MRTNDFYFTLDIKRTSRFVIPKVVNGDTSNVFHISVQDDGADITLSDSLDKVVAVFRRADGKVYTQDADHGVSFASGDNVVIVDVASTSFRSGINTIELAIYSRNNAESATYPGLITTPQAQFTARNENLSNSSGTSLSQLPMLEQLIEDAQDAIDAAEEATAAAQEATRLAHLAAQSAERAIASIPFIVTAEDPMWNGLNFTAYADCSDETFANAVDAGRPIIVRVLGSDEDSIISMYQVSQDAGTHDIICENSWMECSIYVGGAMIEVSGGAKHA